MLHSLVVLSASPFDNDSSGLFDLDGWLASVSGWTDYIIWTFIFLFVAGLLWFAGRAVYGIVAKNGEIQKDSIFGAMVCLSMLLVMRLGIPLFFAVMAYGVNQFLYDIIHFISGSLLYISAGVFGLSACFFFLYVLIRHPGVRRRGIHFMIAGAVLIVLSIFVPSIFLQV